MPSFELESRLLDALGAAEARAARPEDLYAALAREIARSLPADAVMIFVARGSREFIERAAIPERKAKAVRLVVNHAPPGYSVSERVKPWNPSWRGRFRACRSITVRTDKLACVVQVGFKKPPSGSAADNRILIRAVKTCLSAADRIELIGELAAREEQIRALAEHIMQVEEAERRRLSRELHDDAGQSLVCIRLQMELLEHSLPRESPELRARLAESRDLVEKTILDVRRLIADLSPAVLDQLGLWPAIRQLINRFRRSYPCRIRLRGGPLDAVPPRQQIITYRVLQECCSNIAKHSSASRVNISLASTDGVLRLHVRDDGVGFKLEEGLAKPESFGLAGMRERVTLLGGRFRVESRPAPFRGKGRGTEIHVEIPIRESQK